MVTQELDFDLGSGYAGQFLYLGLQINGKNSIKEEIILRIQAKNRSLFANKKFLTNKDLNAASKLQIYRVSQEERTKLQEGVPYVKLYRYNPKHLYPKLNGYGDNGQRSLKL